MLLDENIKDKFNNNLKDKLNEYHDIFYKFQGDVTTTDEGNVSELRNHCHLDGAI